MKLDDASDHSSEVWYRYEDFVEGQGYIDVDGEYVSTGSRVRVRCWYMPLIKRTPQGHVVRDIWGGRRFIADRWTKKYACPTKELALESFIARKRRQIGIYEGRAAKARAAIELASHGKEHPSLSGGFIV